MTRYYEIIDRLGQKPVSKPYKELLKVARGEAFQVMQYEIVDGYGKGWRQTGSTKILSIDQDPITKSSSGQQQVHVNTCLDVSGVDLVDRSGRSVIDKNRPERPAYALLLVMEKNAWYITRDRNGKQKC